MPYLGKNSVANTLALLLSGVKTHTTSRPSQPDLKSANEFGISTQDDTLGDHQSGTNVTKALTSSRKQYHHVTSSSRELEKGNHSSSTAINSSPTMAKHLHPGCRKLQQNSQRAWFPTPTTHADNAVDTPQDEPPAKMSRRRHRQPEHHSDTEVGRRRRRRPAYLDDYQL